MLGLDLLPILNSMNKKRRKGKRTEEEENSMRIKKKGAMEKIMLLVSSKSCFQFLFFLKG